MMSVSGTALAPGLPLPGAVTGTATMSSLLDADGAAGGVVWPSVGKEAMLASVPEAASEPASDCMVGAPAGAVAEGRELEPRCCVCDQTRAAPFGLGVRFLEREANGLRVCAEMLVVGAEMQRRHPGLGYGRLWGRRSATARVWARTPAEGSMRRVAAISLSLWARY